jgi:protein-L-isoaspartate(D-aspartate) O-methyltransferase
MHNAYHNNFCDNLLPMNTEMNFDQARHNMIEQQIRTWEVLDQRVLDLLDEIHREDFVPVTYRNLALADIQIPLPHGQVTMTPKVEARLLQVLDIQKSDNVLEVGTGCAYLTALLARTSSRVVSADIFEEFPRQAAEKLSRHRINNVILEHGDAINGWDKQKNFDVIVLTGSLPVLPSCFQQQLSPMGRLFVITGSLPVMEAELITRVGKNEWRRESLFETFIPPLIGANLTDTFDF